MKMSILCRVRLLSLMLASAAQGQPHRFADPTLDGETRLDDLIGRLTLEEKINCLSLRPFVPRLAIILMHNQLDRLTGAGGIALSVRAGLIGVLLCVIGATGVFAAETASTTTAPPNVLLIAIDDLNDWVGCLGGHPDGKSPHIDQLAQEGRLFSNAHCQAPICNPSRTSVMYGLRPSTTGVYMNAPKPWTVPALSEMTTLPRYFAAHGYRTYTTGKIYHGSGLPENDFDVVGPRPGQRQKIDRRLVPESRDGAKGLWDFGGQTYDEELFQDHADATWAIDQIAEHAEQKEKPFFMAIGFYRPHVPFYAPERIVRQVTSDGAALPPVQLDDWDDIPPIARQVAVSPAAPPHEWFVNSGRWADAVAAYLACVRWTDEQVGRVMQALRESEFARNTVVVLYSDHGFFLGEKQRWAKQSLWERATHVPLIIAGPGVQPGADCDAPVELLSIYPTLIELCRLPQRNELEGVSLRPLLRDPAATWPHVALTTHGRNNHAVRTRTHRYIRYHDGSEELYDMGVDPREWTNLAGRDDTGELRRALRGRLPGTNAIEAKASGNKGVKKKAR